MDKKEYNRLYRERNREYYRQYSKMYREKHPEKYREYSKKYKATRKKTLLERYKENNKRLFGESVGF